MLRCPFLSWQGHKKIVTFWAALTWIQFCSHKQKCLSRQLNKKITRCFKELKGQFSQKCKHFLFQNLFFKTYCHFIMCFVIGWVPFPIYFHWIVMYTWGFLLNIYAFSRRFYPKRITVHSGYTFFLYSVCVPWELNPQPFALLMQCSTTEPQEHRNTEKSPSVFSGRNKVM